jgi:tetratricopeptide (TPR) repeat protein
MRSRPAAIVSTITLLGLAACGGAAPSPTPPVAPASRAAVAVSAAAPQRSSGLGRLDFPVTGSAECQRHFTEGMLALHSFLYDQAHVSFGAALAADPKCAMAAWGDAMAYDEAIWDNRDVAKGRAALAHVVGEEALTPKERAYLRIARADYEKDLTKDAHVAWLAAASAMHRDYPDDDEVTLQYALALLSNYIEDDGHVREQMEAGSLALQVLQRNPQHPGAAHYVIHAFDSPDHAILALPAARVYARIAPAGSHALHMPSHVFTQLGMWRDVVPSNEQAYAASVAWETSRGHTPSDYDWHAYSWLVAAHLELGQRAAAKKLTEEAGARLVASKDDSSDLRDNYLSMVTDYVSQSGRWEELEAMMAPVLAPAFDEGSTPGERSKAGHAVHVACAMHAPGGKGASRLPTVLIDRVDADFFRAETAIRLGDESTAIKRLADAKARQMQMAPWKTVMGDRFVKAWDARGELLLVRAQSAASPSADAQKTVVDALDKYLKDHPDRGASGPAMEPTTRELLGDALLAGGRPKEALAKFESNLELRPNRALSLLGAARAAKAAGDRQKARAHYGELAELWKDADRDLPELAEVKAGAKD